MQNIKELRNSLADNYEKLKAKKMPLDLGKQLANTAGKIINSLKVELEYNQFLNIKNNIDFLENKCNVCPDCAICKNCEDFENLTDTKIFGNGLCVKLNIEVKPEFSCNSFLYKK